MTGFAKLVAKIAPSLMAFALVGALFADNHGLNAVAGAAIAVAVYSRLGVERIDTQL